MLRKGERSKCCDTDSSKCRIVVSCSSVSPILVWRQTFHGSLRMCLKCCVEVRCERGDGRSTISTRSRLRIALRRRNADKANSGERILMGRSRNTLRRVWPNTRTSLPTTSLKSVDNLVRLWRLRVVDEDSTQSVLSRPPSDTACADRHN
jgi:hypothetical protein